MPYSIVTKDDITIDNIPDSVPRDDPSLKERVAAARAARDSGQAAPATAPAAESSLGNKLLGLVQASPIGSSASAVANFAEGGRNALTDFPLAVQQAAAEFGLGDKKKLGEEAAAKKAAEAPVSSTSAGQVGNLVGNVAPMMVGGAGLVKGAIPMIPKALKVAAKAEPWLNEAIHGTGWIGNIVRGAASGAPSGAVSEVLSPAENYNLTDKAEHGATWGGAGGAVLGPLIKAIVNPTEMIVNPVKALAAKAVKAGMPDFPVLAKNVATHPLVKMLTDTVEQSPFGGGVKKAMEKQDTEVTKQATKMAGMETSNVAELTPIKDRLVRNIKDFKSGPSVPTKGIDQQIMTIVAEVEPKIVMAGSPYSSVRQGVGMAQAASYKPTVNAETAISVRQRLSDKMWDTRADPEKSAIYRMARDAWDDAIKGTHPDKGVAFDKWREEWRNFERLKEARVASGPATEQVSPLDMIRTMSPDAQTSPKTAWEKLLVNTGKIYDQAPATQNRALAARAIMDPGAMALGGAPAASGFARAAGGALDLVGMGKLLGTEGGRKYLEHGLGPTKEASQSIIDKSRRALLLSLLEGTR